MEFIHKVPSVEAYNKLRVNSGMNSTKPNDQWFDENTHESSFITLVAKVPADKLYRKHHFCYLPENRVGMIRDK